MIMVRKNIHQFILQHTIHRSNITNSASKKIYQLVLFSFLSIVHRSMYQCDNQEQIENQTPIARTKDEKKVKFAKCGNENSLNL